MQNVKHQTWRWQRYHWMDGKDTIMLQNLAAADIEVPDDDGGPSEYYSFCVTSGYCECSSGESGLTHHSHGDQSR